MTIAIIIALALYAHVLFGRRFGVWPFRGRVDAVGDMLWYEAANALQAAHVQHVWDLRTAAMEAEGRLFMVPGRAGCVTWDHLDAWRPFMAGLRTRTHYLRIVHNHERHDMDNDAVAVEFAAAADRDAFLSRVPEGGPEPFRFADLLDEASRTELLARLELNRLRTEAEAA